MSPTAVRSALCLVAAALVLVGALGAPVAAAPGTTVTSDTVTTADGTAYVWQSSATELRVETDRPIPSSASVCIGPEGGNGSVACTPGDGNNTVALSVPDWPGGVTGPQTVYVNGSDGRTAISERAVYVMTETGDIDDDGLTNRAEIDGNTGFRTADTDNDGLDDGTEVNTHGTDPTDADTDGDGLDDTAEVQTYNTNPTKADTDGDGLGDGAEVNDHSTNPTESDSDGDGLDDAAEIQTYDTNPNKVDTDGDGLTDGEEVNTHETNPNKADTDGDNLDDAAEVNVHSTNPNKPDTDGDGLADGAEVNVHGTDPTKADTDGDGVGDQVEIDRGSDPGEVGDSEETVPPDLGFALVGAAVLVGGGSYLWWRRRRGGAAAATTDDDGDDSGGAAPVDPAAATPVATGPVPETTGSSPEQAAEQAPETESTVDTDGEPEPDPYDEPLTREDEIIAILEEAGGRLEQSTIVSKTGWSKATVSRVLSSMAEEGHVTKISLGRRNLITLPGHEPDGARSPFEKTT